MGNVLGNIQKIDLDILMFIHNYLTNSYMDKTMIFATNLGDNSAIWIFIAIIMICTEKYRKEGVMVLAVLVLTNLLGELLLKNIIGRARPFEYVENIKLLINKPTSFSFPSGHTASSFAAACILSYTFKRFKVWFYALASIIAFSRLYLFVHNPTDIIGGIILGCFSGIIVISIFDMYKMRKFNKLR